MTDLKPVDLDAALERVFEAARAHLAAVKPAAARSRTTTSARPTSC